MAEFKEISPNAPLGAKVHNWFDNRFPTMFAEYRKHMSEYFAPKNFNFWYFFGSLALLVLVIQIVTGIFLTMNYKPDAAKAFESVEYIMRDVYGGWFIRYMHSTGASAFFIVVYLHMFRGLLYGSYRKPRELVWIFGCAIFLALMAEAFMGYLLPWGQMSYWGAQVIVNLFSAIPFIGPDLALLIRGDYVVGDATLNRFFAFHVIAVPLVLIGLVVAHLLALHDVGSNNPDGIEIKAGPKGNRWSPTAPTDGIPFHPYYSVHDIVGVGVFLMAYFAVVFFAPEMGGYFLEYNNFIPADPLVTPPHIAPVWYFTAFYSMLRATTDLMVNVLVVIIVLATVLGFLRCRCAMAMKVGMAVAALVAIALLKTFDAKFWGVVVMGGAVLILFVLPWLDRSPARSIRYRPGWHKWVYAVFVVWFLVLMVLGIMAPGPLNPSLPEWLTNEFVAMIGTLFYFAFFLLMPWWSQLGTPKPVPDRITFKPH
ncbi:MAG TPA: cytochrome bc complex cytochrome b subunit [Ottowia sp.]|uniref:cytochrome b n=1 Tax=Ottowia sp. TaxID=1898956 RepID=UPI002C2A76A1|nr:cytochrome bc complex cytochrome b subunit [Ottowia sp.]HMN19882.1 cytochrome bc complex cytochrome b subunit [Ottowia sp.]